MDGYAGFEALANCGAVTLAACWSHMRRKFYELHEAGLPVAAEALRRNGEIYRVETAIRGYRRMGGKAFDSYGPDRSSRRFGRGSTSSLGGCLDGVAWPRRSTTRSAGGLR